MNIINILDLLGTFAFAISGFITASNKKFDLFGASVIAFITALGGGTLRDILLGSYPVGWIKNQSYLIVIIIAILFSILLKKHIEKLVKMMFLFDTIGIGVFTILGLQKTLDLGFTFSIAIMMGTVSAVFGGVVRDTIANDIPLIFRKELYATTCIIGGALYILLMNIFLSNSIAIITTITFIIIFRITAVRKKWSLPVL